MIGAAKGILPDSFREPSAHGVLENVSHCSLDGVAGPQHAVVVALLPQTVSLEFPSSDSFNTLLRQFFVAAKIRRGRQAFEDEMNMVWHHTVRESCKHFELARFLNLINRRMCQSWRREDRSSRPRVETQ